MTTLTTINALASPEVQMNENFEAVSPAGLFGIRRPVTTGLVFGYFGGIIANGTSFTTVANGTLTLTNGATNYIETTTGGSVSSNTTGFTAGRVPLYEVVTSGGVMTSITDRRVLMPSLFNGPLTGTTLTIATGTITASNPALTRTQTWNSGGTTFIGSTTNITDTASATASLIERWQVGGVDKVSIRKDGLLSATNLAQATGTITTSQPSTLTQTWNAGGVTFTGRSINVTDTASAAASLLEDWQVGGSSKASIRKDGLLTLTGGATIGGALAGATTGAFSGQITSTVSTGTAPFSITSTTEVANLNVAQLKGKTWASPDPIGTGTPAAATVTTLTTSSTVTHNGGTANRIPYLDGSKVLQSALFYDGSKLGMGGVTSPRGDVELSGNSFDFLLTYSPSSYAGLAMGFSSGDYGAVGFGFKPSTDTYMNNGSDLASRFFFGSGKISLQTAPSGSNGAAITWATRLECDNAGSLKFGAYGAGTLQTDASGNVTASSDPSIKRAIKPYTKGLADLVKLVEAGGVIRHGYAIASGLDLSRVDYAGFDAAITREIFPEAVGQDARGKLTLSERPISAAQTNAIAEIAARLQRIEQHLSLH